MTNPQYEALGIHAETWACVAILTKQEASTLLFALAASGVPALLSKDADGKRWHIAVQGGLATNPLAYVVSLRGLPYDIITCPVGSTGQHPQARRLP
jgi:hypothetical protein